MRRIVLTLVGAALIAASTTQMASAAEHHHARKAVTSQQFRNAHASVVTTPEPQVEYSGGWSAPAGR